MSFNRRCHSLDRVIQKTVSFTRSCHSLGCHSFRTENIHQRPPLLFKPSSLPKKPFFLHTSTSNTQGQISHIHTISNVLFELFRRLCSVLSFPHRSCKIIYNCYFTATLFLYIYIYSLRVLAELRAEISASGSSCQYEAHDVEQVHGMHRRCRLPVLPSPFNGITRTRIEGNPTSPLRTPGTSGGEPCRPAWRLRVKSLELTSAP